MLNSRNRSRRGGAHQEKQKADPGTPKIPDCNRNSDISPPRSVPGGSLGPRGAFRVTPQLFIFYPPYTIYTSLNPLSLGNIHFIGGSVGISFPVFGFIYNPRPNAETINTRNRLDGTAKGGNKRAAQESLKFRILLVIPPFYRPVAFRGVLGT